MLFIYINKDKLIVSSKVLKLQAIIKMTTISSIYIPRMSAKYNEEFVEHIFDLYRIGMVSRVDFTPINKKAGFVENVDSIWKSAFVHLVDTTTIPANPYGPEYEYNEEAWESINSGNCYKIQVSKYEDWFCLKNKKPIQKTLMNIHQVVENGRHLENLVQQQAKMLEQQTKMLEQQTEKLKGVEDVVYYLLGGLFNQRTQEETLDYLLDRLLQRPKNEDDEGIERKKTGDTSRWTQWPTTRQGDDCEKRIAALEEKLAVESTYENYKEDVNENHLRQNSSIESEENLKNMTDKDLEYYYYKNSTEENMRKRIKEARKRVVNFRRQHAQKN